MDAEARRALTTALVFLGSGFGTVGAGMHAIVSNLCKCLHQNACTVTLGVENVFDAHVGARHRSNRSHPQYSISIDIGNQQVVNEAIQRSPATGYYYGHGDGHGEMVVPAPAQPWHVRVKSGDVEADYTEINGCPHIDFDDNGGLGNPDCQNSQGPYLTMPTETNSLQIWGRDQFGNTV